jgi:hypothetical protein
MRFFLAILLWIVSTYVFAGTTDPNTPDSQYIEYGSKFHCVLKICGAYDNQKLFCASAVAIQPHWILTAAHVVKDCTVCFVTVEDKKHCVSKVIYHELYHENNFGEYDLALGYVTEDIGLNFYPKLYETKDEINKVCSIAGFGLTGTFNNGIAYSDNKRRAGSNVVEAIERKLLICTPTRHNRTALEFLIGSGDSGGGLFIANKLAGINSCVMAGDGKPDSTYGDESGHTRISLYIDWINKNIEENTNEK